MPFETEGDGSRFSYFFDNGSLCEAFVHMEGHWKSGIIIDCVSVCRVDVTGFL